MYKQILTPLLSFAMLLIIAFPSLLSAQEATDKEQRIYKNLQLFGNALSIIRQNYVEEVDDEKLIEAAIEGMLQSLDPHSTYLNAKEFEDMKIHTTGQFGGLGIEITMEDGLVKIISPIDGTPAEKAGLRPGDLISRINQKPVFGMTLRESVSLMRGEPGTSINITIIRGKETFDINIIRAIIKIKAVKARLESDNIAYLRITTFNETVPRELVSAFDRLKKQAKNNLVGIVLDLRNNPGGLLETAYLVTDMFLEQGEVVSTRGRNNDYARRYNAAEGDITDKLPIVVLINSGSASASEIVAGALQDHDRAIIMGTDSFGKGSVQTIKPITKKTAVKLTTSRYYTPSGKSIQNEGIIPDIFVEQAKLEFLDSSNARREKDLNNNLENTKNNADVSKQQNTKQSQGQDDYQLSRAIDLLRGLDVVASLKNNAK